MAFSTFRGMMAGNIHGVPPVTLAGVYPRTSALIGSLNTSNASDLINTTLLPSSTSQYFTAYLHSSGNTLYGCMMDTSHTGYVTTGTPLLVDTTSGSITLAGDSVSATGYLLAYQSQPSSIYSLVMAYVTSSGTTLTLATSPTAFYSNQVNGVVACGVLNSTNALILGGTTSAQNMALINPTTLTSYSTQSLSLGMAVGAPKLNKLLGMSSTLCSLLYTSIGGNITYIGIDVVAGTSFTVNSLSTIVLPSNPGSSFACAKISATTILIAYGKNTTTMAARILTVGSGGSVSVGTEYTFVTGSTTQNANYQCAVLSSTLAILSVRPSALIGAYTIPIQISGTAITFGSKYPTVTNNSFSGRADLVPMSSTSAAMLYGVDTSGISSPATGNICYGNVLDYNAANPTWNSTFAGHNVISPNTTFSATDNLTQSIAYLGTNRALVNWRNTGTSVGWGCFQLDTNSSNILRATTAVSVTGIGTANTSGQCRVFNDTASNTRLCGYYQDASNNVQFAVLYVGTDGSVSINTTNTSYTSTSTRSMMVNVSADKSLYIQGTSTKLLQASLITTSGANVSTIGALTTMDTGGSNNNVGPLFAQNISSTLTIVVYQRDNGLNTHSGAWAAIIDTSSGTPSLVTSQMITPSTGAGGAFTGGFTVGTNRGVVFYNDPSTTSIYAIGFSYTNSTITASVSPVTIGTTSDFALGSSVGLNCVGVSGTELLLAVNSINLGGNYAYVVTTSSINSISVGTGFAAPAGYTGSVSQLVTTENQNAVAFNGFISSGGFFAKAGYFFRG